MRDRVARVRRRVVLALQRLTDRVLERRYGVDTARHVTHEELGIPSTDEHVWHHPSDWISVRRVFERLRPTPSDVFVDIGSGLGRAVLLAARLRFGRVIGVEFSTGMTEIARANVERARNTLRCPDVELVAADATTWEVPDDVTVVYLYCPFTGETFARVLDRILESVERSPRVLRLVYNYPFEHNRVLASGRAEVLDVAPRSWPARTEPDDVIVTYLLLPEAGRDSLPADAPRPGASVRDRPEWLGPYDPGFKLEKPAAADV